jgi:hypothetical protein
MKLSIGLLSKSIPFTRDFGRLSRFQDNPCPPQGVVHPAMTLVLGGMDRSILYGMNSV